MENNLVDLNSNHIKDLIYTIRGKQVMLDRDLALLYQVQTKRLNEQVKRNIERFPENFMFRLTGDEYTNLRLQFATTSLDGNHGENIIIGS
ncbi:ORF6N domain-containing protein [Oceanivirga salmonicida]|uniref:ORF6N domain-containing protein n=1 Tax=Oceanivirga salmonicida TaxID=1769291 RepID=UPI0012E30786|nr:ORF6N domain-containing protein [Oceanivirga salmonicida]